MLLRVDDRWALLTRVGALYTPDIEDLCLDIEPDTPLGFFLASSLPRLTDYCIGHTELHVITLVSDRIVLNKAVPGAYIFMLAAGDANPSLAYDRDGEVSRDFYRSLYSRFSKREP